MLRRALSATIVALIFAALMSAAGATVARADACAAADAVPGDDAARAQAARAVLCLVNRARVAQHMRQVRFSRSLGAAARFHGADMVANGFFSHEGSAGDDLAARVRASGYSGSHPGSSASETLVWGTDVSPRDLVQDLLQSGEHRRIVLDPRQRSVGLGLVLGAPLAGVALPSATLVLDFGD